MRNLTLGQILTYLSFAVTGASFLRLLLHWLRGVPLLLLWFPYDENKLSKFWRIYQAVEDTAAYIAISLGKFARKGSGQLIVIPETKEAIDHKLTTLGTDTDEVTRLPMEENE